MRYKLNIQNFAPAMVKVTINFDSNINKVVLIIDEQIYEWTTSGQESDYLALFDGTDYTFEVTLNDGYVLDTVTLLGNEQQGTLKSKTDNSFIITAGSGAIGNITLTSKQATPTTGTIKFGTVAPTKYYLGNKAVDRIYMGTVLLYKKAIVYTITANLANCTANSDNPITIEENGGAILYYTANTGYELPDGVELTNVGSYNWDKTTGKLVIARPSGNVTIKIVAKQSMPQLATPQNVSVENTTLSFDEVENAEEYEVFVDNVSIGSYTKPSYILTSDSIAPHNIEVNGTALTSLPYTLQSGDVIIANLMGMEDSALTVNGVKQTSNNQTFTLTNTNIAIELVSGSFNGPKVTINYQ